MKYLILIALLAIIGCSDEVEELGHVHIDTGITNNEIVVEPESDFIFQENSDQIEFEDDVVAISEPSFKDLYIYAVPEDFTIHIGPDVELSIKVIKEEN